MIEDYIPRMKYIDLGIVLDVLCSLMIESVITIEEHECERAALIEAAGWTEAEISTEVDRLWSVDDGSELVEALLIGPDWC